MADNHKTHLNKAHFDNEASEYDAKHEKATAQIARHIEARRDFIGVQWVDDEDDSDEEGSEQQRAVRLLDYACGTGSMSRALAPYTTQCVGIDLSEKMVSTYNTRARNQGLSEDEMAAYEGNLAVPDDESPAAFGDTKFFNFDIAVVGLGFHHFDDPELAAKRLVSRLKLGGVLMIIDFLPHGPHKHSGHGHNHDHEAAIQTVTFHGFSEERIQEIFVNAGAGKDFAIDRISDVSFRNGSGEEYFAKRTLFMARGTKA